ncbi:hypothetical protein EJB05_21669, partial [Eragrostis curvula]
MGFVNGSSTGSLALVDRSGKLGERRQLEVVGLCLPVAIDAWRGNSEMVDASLFVSFSPKMGANL